MAPPINSGNPELDQKITEWINWDKNDTTLYKIRCLAAEGNFDELSNLLLKRLKFGTAGLRGVMSAGYACMNDLVIIQTAQGFVKYLESSDLDLLNKNGIVVGYDGRYNSRRWAELTATVFARAGHPVKLFSQVVPTPFVPYTVKKYDLAAGVMVTASHNPKNDNGYKVYGFNGCQIIPPVDKNIQDSILNNLEPLATSWDTSFIFTSDLVTDPLTEVTCSYMSAIQNKFLDDYIDVNKSANVLFTYTAMHGVGYKFMKKIFDLIGVNFVTVTAQRDPHPDFPTVAFPNPEEGKSSLDLSIKTAEKNNSRIILANDPDADRFAVAEKNPKTGEWKIFSGNELGALFGWWMLRWFKNKFPNRPLKEAFMGCSTVSSKILKTMANAEGFTFFETLTGFKWIGNKVLELEKECNAFVFAFEEAIGFMTMHEVLDKDGISAAFHFACMVSHLYTQNKTVNDKLQEIYAQYGQHLSRNSYYICHDPVKINAIFDRIRNFSGPNTYPTGVLGDKYKITGIRDLTTGYDDSQPDKKATLPVDPTAQMITFNFDSGLVCTLRTSGTEPKIKYYTELCADPKLTDLDQITKMLNEQVDAICEEFFEPTKNGLQARKE